MDHTVSQVAILSLEAFLRFHLKCHHLYFNEAALGSLQVTITSHDLFLIVECLDDNTNEKLHEEHANDNDEHHSVHDHEWAIVFLWLHVWANSVNGIPQDINPALSRLDSDQSKHRCKCGVKVEIRLNPLASIVDAIIHRHYVLLLLLHTQVKMVCGASEHLP